MVCEVGGDGGRHDGLRVRFASDFGNIVRAERRARGLTQAEFAAEMGVSRKWLSEVENGKDTAEVGLILMVLRKMGLDLVLAARRPPSIDIDAFMAKLARPPEGPRSGECR